MILRIAEKTCLLIVAAATLCLLLGLSTPSGADAKNAELIRMLNCDDRDRRCTAAQQLGERGLEDAVEPLIERLKVEKDYSVRIVIAKSLLKIGDPQAIPVLKDLAKNDKNRTVRHLAKVIAAEMEKLAATP